VLRPDLSRYFPIGPLAAGHAFRYRRSSSIFLDIGRPHAQKLLRAKHADAPNLRDVYRSGGALRRRCPAGGPIALIAAIMDRETFTIGSSRFGGNLMDIRSAAPAVAGQMRLIQVAIDGLRKDPKVPPLNVLSPGQLYKRVDKYLEAQGFTIKERPSRSTFERFRRQFGAAIGVL
jgi:hypothetical protein